MAADLVEREPLLKHLAARHGAGKVWSVGMTSLGYPPTWTIGVKALTTLTNALEISNG